MDASFRALVAALEPKLRQLLAMPPVAYGALTTSVPKRAILCGKPFLRSVLRPVLRTRYNDFDNH